MHAWHDYIQQLLLMSACLEMGKTRDDHYCKQQDEAQAEAAYWPPCFVKLLYIFCLVGSPIAISALSVDRCSL